ncbi:MAG: hypothetical protein IK005_01650 [Paludibacteraceae bacterium]|nr:hypothetical protein [Paludibacteraceae bacterium]
MWSNTKRGWTGIFLLAIYLILLSASSLHTHQHEKHDFSCQDCISHVKHNGHISTASPTVGECLLCDFSTTPYLSIPLLALPVLLLGSCCHAIKSIQNTNFRKSLVLSLRAPPCL